MLVFELDDFIAVNADEMVVVGVFVIVGVVDFMVATKVQLFEDSTFDEELQSAVDRGAGDGGVDIFGQEEEFFGGVMIGGAEGGDDDGVALGGFAEAFGEDKGVEPSLNSGRHRRKVSDDGGGVKPPERHWGSDSAKAGNGREEASERWGEVSKAER